MIYQPLSSPRKLERLWLRTSDNKRVSESFKTLDLSNQNLDSTKLFTKVVIAEEEDSIWFGSFVLTNVPSFFSQLVYPVAFFTFQNKGIPTETIPLVGGTFYYWFHQLNETTVLFRYAVDATLDTTEGYNLNLSLIFYNNRIYDTTQTRKE